MLHPLEPRLCLAAVTAVENGILNVAGTPRADTISVEFNPLAGQIIVSVNSLTASLPAAEVKSIRIAAGKGNDRVTIGEGVRAPADINGGPGNDRLRGGSRKCHIYGEDGHDTLVGGVRNDILSGGAGIDTADYSLRTDRLVLSLDGNANDGSAAGRGERDNIDVERIIGGSGNDVISGNSQRNTLQGGDGNDSLTGDGGDDVLVGGAGADTLRGGAGDDMLLGIDLNVLDVLDGGPGFDSATRDSATADHIVFTPDTFLGIEAELYTLLNSTP